MPWSQRKTRLEALFAPSLGGQLAIHRTSFRAGYDLAARAWISFEGRTVWECRTTRADPQAPAPFADEQLLADEPPITPRDFDDAVVAYPDLAIDAALASPSAVIRALALLDRRTGKRRLLAFDPDAFAHPLERTLLALRLRAEGLPPLTGVRPPNNF